MLIDLQYKICIICDINNKVGGRNVKRSNFFLLGWDIMDIKHCVSLRCWLDIYVAKWLKQ